MYDLLIGSQFDAVEVMTKVFLSRLTGRFTCVAKLHVKRLSGEN